MDIKEDLEKELEDIYIQIGENNGDVDDSLYVRASEIEDILNPQPEITIINDYNCHCNRRDCWECVYKDDPMGI